jgi:hypothetical protein
MDPLISMGAKMGTALTKDTEDQWKGLPGTFDIRLDHATFLYNVTNRDDVSICRIL